MKIVDNAQAESWENKTNFVDKNNVVLGWDMSQNCCESFGVIFSREIPTSRKEDDPPYPSERELEPYVFDPSFCVNNSIVEEYADQGGSRTFKLTDGDAVLYLTIYNHHNGYYSHGFTLDVGGKRIIDDGI